jgi:hypothetical protein
MQELAKKKVRALTTLAILVWEIETDVGNGYWTS